ncbi:hypothetical protein [Streptomyces sp. NPDC047009]|uniref:hypothetical protein n=1 Tax=unclassified Streptomyces TaxID=2593676 RepID=UPI0033CB7CA1
MDGQGGAGYAVQRTAVSPQARTLTSSSATNPVWRPPTIAATALARANRSPTAAGAGSPNAALAMVFTLVESAQ